MAGSGYLNEARAGNQGRNFGQRIRQARRAQSRSRAGVHGMPAAFREPWTERVRRSSKRRAWHALLHGSRGGRRHVLWFRKPRVVGMLRAMRRARSLGGCAAEGRGGITGRLGALGKTKEGTKSAAALGLWCLPACPLPSCRRAFIAPAAKRGSGTRDCPRARRPRGSAVVTTVDERAVWVHRPRKHSVVLAPSVIKPFRYSHTLLGTSASTLGFCATPEYA